LAQTALIGFTGDRPPQLAQPISLLNQVPANSLVVAASRDLNQFWQQVETGLITDSPLQDLVQGFVTNLQTPLGLDLPQDIFSWVQGEYSLALLPREEKGQSDWVFLAERLPNVDIDTAISRLDELAQNQGYNVQELTILGQDVTTWTKLKTSAKNKISSLETQVRGLHTTVNNTEILASSLEAMSQVLATPENLANSVKFQQAISALPVSNNGYFYLDWNNSEPILQQRFPFLRVLELSVKPLFKNLRSLTLSSEGNVEDVRRSSVYLNLGVREKV
ncbi:MAG: DUF3352 domain-containing protein, partial [Microcystaceae cyanobacterium]